MRWRKSSHSFESDASTCVEAASTGRDARVLLRDSKHPEHSHLRLSAPTWASLLDGLKRG
ncbi:DUF397 domain-containing protein [Actinocorallia longicatena]|uniref:DUF397 domain-containing protein n=1 Tax=Actinocorallia longicatena TaxID=111803 RepID=A0ABP6QA64_9ACTN